MFSPVHYCVLIADNLHFFLTLVHWSTAVYVIKYPANSANTTSYLG